MKNPLNHVRISLRLLCISAAFSLPIGVLLFLMVKGVNENIHFARWETYGDEYQRPLMALLDELPQHQLAAGNATRQAELQGRINAAFADLASVQARLGVQLGFTAEELAKRKRDHVQLVTVKKEWDELKARASQLSADSNREKHTHLVADVRLMIAHSIRKSERGVVISAKVAASLQDIAGKARKVDALVAEISAAGAAQSTGIRQISESVQQMDHVTQNNAAGAEQSAAASEQLNAEAADVQRAVTELIVLIGGQSSAAKIQSPAADSTDEVEASSVAARNNFSRQVAAVAGGKTGRAAHNIHSIH